jgi:hypothetical protein
MHPRINLGRLGKHREKLTPRQAPSTYTDVQTKTISVPVTEVRSDQRLTDYPISPFHKRQRALTDSHPGFYIL